MKSTRTETRLSGSGGQGLILAGIILANAAVLDKKNVTQTQSYGPESRGGASRADVLISNDAIYYPEATQFNVLLALTQEACDKYIFDLREDGILIADSTYVKNISMIDSSVYERNFTEIAMEELGSALPTNILTLSFLVQLTKVVTVKSLEQAIRNTVKPAFVDLNIKAMKLGFKLAKEEQ